MIAFSKGMFQNFGVAPRPLFCSNLMNPTIDNLNLIGPLPFCRFLRKLSKDADLKKNILPLSHSRIHKFQFSFWPLHRASAVMPYLTDKYVERLDAIRTFRQLWPLISKVPIITFTIQFCSKNCKDANVLIILREF